MKVKFGALFSNGNVYLINPNGVFIGPNGRIETAGFAASTLDVLNEDFLMERCLLFSGDSQAQVVNLGMIFCETGNVALIGRRVANEGAIEAPEGTVGLGVGTEVLLRPESTPYIYIRAGISSGGAPEMEGAALLNAGTIEALAVELKSRSNVFEKAIQCKGIVDAMGVESRGGEVYLVADEGLCELDGSVRAMKGDVGGTVHVLGEYVIALDDAKVDVSGERGGGTILVGGDYQGQNLDVMSARRTFVGKGADFKADALNEGDGGKVIVWSYEATFFNGHISACGGPNGGNGGMAGNVRDFDYQGLAELYAPLRKMGNAAPRPLRYLHF